MPFNLAVRVCILNVRNPWFASELRKTQRTPEVKQLLTKDMKEIESLAEDAPPLSVDDRDRISAANRYFQVGASACQSLLDSAVTGVNPEPSQIILVDLFSRTGDMLEAFGKMRTGRSNIHYIGFCESAEEVAFLESMMTEQLAEQYESGSPMPNGDRVAQQMSVDLIEAAPPQPRLNICATKPLFIGWHVFCKKVV